VFSFRSDEGFLPSLTWLYFPECRVNNIQLGFTLLKHSVQPSFSVALITLSLSASKQISPLPPGLFATPEHIVQVNGDLFVGGCITWDTFDYFNGIE
jgi:hypothetical protein